ncbi:GNAT family N-acetyltransferase [Nakamurella endophytica]|uniref:N-acetyltransferase domain-containing protein n=1 Tax=Nakamurella endophytica TaxID=1748367 RepID=A0A917WBA1_9ACTN|nr:GNAT family N-acetyltransferase [Nakamurella endophytica]GGL90820.1 hypothetical protein GCM10011594_08060 [Nakamurella endophytica]
MSPAVDPTPVPVTDPNPDPHRVPVTELERIAALGWRGTTVERLGGWLLRAGSGFTGRANSVLPLGDPGLALPAAIAHAERFYARHGLPVAVQQPDAGPGTAAADLAAELDRRGWSTSDPVLVLVAPLAQVLDRSPAADVLPPAALAARPDAAWLSGYLYRGAPLPPTAVDVLLAADRPVFASLVLDGSLAGVARAVVDEGWLGITALTVDPGHRRRGLGCHLVGELARWGAAQSARSVYLQVDGGNAAALALYDRLGFRRHHEYRYRRPPG